MKLTVFYGKIDEIEGKVNEFLSNLPTKDIYKVETIAYPIYSQAGTVVVSESCVAVFVWTKA